MSDLTAVRHFGDFIPKPAQSTVTRWKENPYVMGTYSYIGEFYSNKTCRRRQTVVVCTYRCRLTRGRGRWEGRRPRYFIDESGQKFVLCGRGD